MREAGEGGVIARGKTRTGGQGGRRQEQKVWPSSQEDGGGPGRLADPRTP